ncbi:MAG: hypothetical protein NUV80_05970, partial [Candidatus Berkelbacteria bacterium]|nr:hypothetical protein [Candidatus Berkelbacteria bacterium]
LHSATLAPLHAGSGPKALASEKIIPAKPLTFQVIYGIVPASIGCPEKVRPKGHPNMKEQWK